MDFRIETLQHVLKMEQIPLLPLVAGLLAKGQYLEGSATGHLGTGFLGFPVYVYKRKLGWFPRLQVATACFSCSPPVLIKIVP